MEEITIDYILSNRNKAYYVSKSDYSNWWWYMIEANNWKKYIGKARIIEDRLYKHICMAKRGKWVYFDIEIWKKIINCKFYILWRYLDYWVNFFSRNLEWKIEQEFIKKYQTYYPLWFNIAYYG